MFDPEMYKERAERFRQYIGQPITWATVKRTLSSDPNVNVGGALRVLQRHGLVRLTRIRDKGSSAYCTIDWVMPAKQMATKTMKRIVVPRQAPTIPQWAFDPNRLTPSEIEEGLRLVAQTWPNAIQCAREMNRRDIAKRYLLFKISELPANRFPPNARFKNV